MSTKSSKVLYPCSLCSKNVINDAIHCDICGLWVHRTCSNMTKKQLMLKSNPNYYYYCSHCVQCMPFMQIDDEELCYLNYDDYMNSEVYNIYNTFKDSQFKLFQDYTF